MPFEVGTKDCTALSDAELAEMADLCVDRAPGFDIGFLSKQCEEWVLVSLAREGSKLRGYSFSTLERIVVPNDLSAVLYPRSSVNRQGLEVQLTGIIDAGYEGALIVPIRNSNPTSIVRIYPGQRFCQIEFTTLTREITMDMVAPRTWAYFSTLEARWDRQPGSGKTELFP